MPRTSVATVQHAVFTDHSIPRQPVPAAQVAVSSDAELIPFGGATASDRELALAYADVALKENNRTLGLRAFKLLEAAYSKYPDDPKIATQLAQIYDRMGREKEACAIYERIVPAHPEAIAAAINLGTCRAKQGDLQRAIELWASVTKRSPDQEGARLNLAVAQLKLGDREAARATIAEAIEVQSSVAAFSGFVEAVLGGWMFDMARLFPITPFSGPDPA